MYKPAVMFSLWSFELRLKLSTKSKGAAIKMSKNVSSIGTGSIAKAGRNFQDIAGKKKSTFHQGNFAEASESKITIETLDSSQKIAE